MSRTVKVRTSRGAVALVGALSLAIAAAGCGGGSGGSSSSSSGGGGGASSTTTAQSSALKVNAGKTVQLSLTAGKGSTNNGYNFNGYANGDMTVSVPVGWTVKVAFDNQGNLPHSAVIVPYAKRDATSGLAPAFPGAASVNPTTGTPSGSSDDFSFVPTTAGRYAIVCAVPGHDTLGMWDVLQVTSSGTPSINTSGG